MVRGCYKKSEEHKRKLAHAQKGKKHSEETKRKIGKASLGHKLSYESRKKLSLSKKIFYQNVTERKKCRQKALERYKRTNGMLEETKEKLSHSKIGQVPWNKGMKMSEKTKKRMRDGAIKRIERQKLNGMPLTPNIGNYETSILDFLEKNCFNYSVLRQYRVAGYFLDGYCPALNLAIEIDESKHKYKKKKDVEREKIIKNHLGCQFLRIKVPGDFYGI